MSLDIFVSISRSGAQLLLPSRKVFQAFVGPFLYLLFTHSTFEPHLFASKYSALILSTFIVFCFLV